jgi:divalent metal cation (Fe/Co/Zn/Cd) transporter
MGFADKVLDLIVGIIIFFIGIYVIWHVGLSLFGGVLNYVISAAVIVFFIYIFIKAGLDL